MSKKGRPRTRGGNVYKRLNSKNLWARYRDREGRIVKESSGTTDWEEAERFLRDRLDARDEGRLGTMLSSKNLTFNEWADWFLEKRSKPPYRAEKTHRDNLAVLKNLRPVFGGMGLSDIMSESIDEYIEERLQSGRKVRTKLGIRYEGKIKPATVHKEYRVLRRILNVAVKQKRLTANPCLLPRSRASMAGGMGRLFAESRWSILAHRGLVPISRWQGVLRRSAARISSRPCVEAVRSPFE